MGKWTMTKREQQIMSPGLHGGDGVPGFCGMGGGVLLRRAVSHCIIRVGGSSVEGG